MGADEALVKPDSTFAAGWYVDDPLAQGVLKLGSVLVLDSLDEAVGELHRDSPDFDDFGLLGCFPRAIRPALTPLLVEKMKTAAVIVGWKLAQPGTPIQPGCLAEELALEMIRQEAVSLLEMEDAPQGTIDALRGIYEVCEDDDVLDLFEMEEPSDAALARFNPINVQAGKADMRITHWFNPFYGGSQGHAPHPFYFERAAAASEPEREPELVIIEPEGDVQLEEAAATQSFRVILRSWDEAWLGLDNFSKIPPQWVYYFDSANAGEALRRVVTQFPGGARQHPVSDDDDELQLDDSQLVRISLDVQAVGLSQDYKAETAAFHVIGSLTEEIPSDALGQLAAYLTKVFPTAFLARYEEKLYVGVTVNAESHEEAEADLSDTLDRFATGALNLERDLLSGYSCGAGRLTSQEMLAELRTYARREI
jgi:hypothetical protein